MAFSVISVILSANASGLSGVLRRAARDVDEFGRRARQGADDTDRLGDSSNRGEQQVSKLGAAAKKAAVSGVVLLGAALVKVVSDAIQFEAAMRNVASIDQTVADNFEEVSQAVLDMSKHLPQSAQSLAEGLYNIAGSGFYGADAMHILEISAVAASAGLTDTDTASKAIVASLNAYGLEASEAGRVSDALFSTVNYGVISFEALTAAVAHSVGNAAKAGVQIEELGAALATMTLSGMSASESGVSLNNLLSKLVKPSKELTRATNALGISLKDDLANPAVGLHGVMEKLRIASEGNLSTLLRWFPEIRAARGAMALFSADGENYARVFGQMGTQQKTAGETARVFAEQAKSTKHQLEILANQVAVTGIEFGLTLLPAVNKAVGVLTEFGGTVKSVAADVADRAAPGFHDLADAVTDVAGVVGDLHLDDLAGLAAKIGISSVVTGFNLLGTAVSSTTGFLSDHQAVVYAVAGAYTAMNIGAVIGLLVRLGTAAQVAAVMGLFRLLDALEVVEMRLRSTTAAAAAASFANFALTAGIAAGAIYGVVSAFQDVERAAQRIADAEFQVGEIISAIDPSVPASYDAARAKLDEMAKANDRAVAANDRSVDGIHQTVLGLAAYDQAVAQVNAQAAILQINTNVLAEVFNLTGAQVQTLAQRYELDLTTGLRDAADGTAGLVTQMRLAVGSMLDAAPATLSEQQAINLLTFDVKTADAALEGLVVTFDLLTGRLVSGTISANNWKLSMIELASGATLATDANGNLSTSLDGSTVAGLQNQNMLLALIQQLESNAQAQYNATVATEGGEAATEAYNATINAGVADLIEFGAQADISAEDIRALTGDMNLVPGEISTNIATPGLSEAISGVDELSRAIAGVERDVWVTMTVSQQRIFTDLGSLPNGGRAAGGPVYGPGSGTSDSVPIMASNGEWVIRAAASQHYGPAAMAAINSGRALVVPMYARGGRIGRFAAGGQVSGGSSGTGGSGAAGAIELVSTGASTLADVYQQTATGVTETVDALRQVVPRLWAAEQRTGYLADSTGVADRAAVRFRNTLVAATGDVDRNTVAVGGTAAGLLGLGEQLNLLSAVHYPVSLSATRNQTLAQQANTAENTLNLAGQQQLATQMDLLAGVQYPAVLLGTQTQTLAQQQATLTDQEHLLGLTTLGVQTDLMSGVQLPVLTAATDLQTGATTLHTGATVEQTGALVETTGASTETTAALGEQTAATDTNTAATGTATGAAGVFTGALGQVTGAAGAATGAVAAYSAALSAIPTQVTTTITTNYVTTGVPAAASGFATGGRVSGPGTATSDSVLARLSAGEWVIRAAAAARYGSYAMAAVNAGTARIVPGFAAGGPVGTVHGSRQLAGAGRTVQHVTLHAPVTVTGVTDPAAVGRVVESKMTAAFDQLTGELRQGAGRGQS